MRVHDELMALGDVRSLQEAIWIGNLLLFLYSSRTFAAGGSTKGFLNGLAPLILNFLSLLL